MRTFVVTFGVLVAAFIIAGAWFLLAPSILMPSVEIADVQQPETLVIGKEEGNHTYAIWIRGTGYIDGEATICFMLNGQPRQAANISGRVEFQFGGDWYTETAEIQYKPVNVRSGKIVVRYQFYHTNP